MEIAFLPAGDITTASTRIRVLSLMPELTRRGVATRLGYSDNADVLVVQKRLSDEIIASASECRKRGRVVVYDCDDWEDALHYSASDAHVRQIVSLANVVTTNTEALAEAIVQKWKPEAVAIVPDCVDYFLPDKISTTVRINDKLKILWFGNRGNLQLIARYHEAVRALPMCSLTICTDQAAEKEVATLVGFSFLPWNVLTFPQILRQFDLTFLPHDGSFADRIKSNNRMITSIAWGVPALATRTPEYHKLAARLGLEGCLVDGPDSFSSVVARWTSQSSRERYLAMAQSEVILLHSPSKVVLEFLSVLEAHKND